MTRSSRRRAHLATLSPSNLSADRQKAVSDYKRARKKADFAYAARMANPSAITVALDIASSALVEEANWDAASALALERSHYSCKCKPAKQERILS